MQQRLTENFHTMQPSLLPLILQLALQPALQPTLPPAAATAKEGPCDIYAAGNTPCVAAHSMTRALFGAYLGPLYQVCSRAVCGRHRESADLLS